jgi:multidrug resistance protein
MTQQTQASTTSPAPQADAAQRRLVQVLFVGVFMAALDSAIVGPVLPALRAAFGIDNRTAGLLTTVFALSSMCSTALMAYFSDRHGRRPVYLVSVALFAIGSLCIAAAPSFDLLLVARAIQGIGAGGIAPVASAVIGDVFTAERRGRILGLIGATHGMAFVLGPPLATLLTSTLGWRWLFLVNIPVALVVLWWGARSLPGQRNDAAPGPMVSARGQAEVAALLREAGAARVVLWSASASRPIEALLMPVRVSRTSSRYPSIGKAAWPTNGTANGWTAPA